MKKTVSILLCLMMFLYGGVGVFAAAPIVETIPTAAPRYKNIINEERVINKYRGGIECIGDCEVANSTTIKITITLKDEHGNKIPRSGKKTGIRYSFATNFKVTPGKRYQVEFAYDAGGERTSFTESITA